MPSVPKYACVMPFHHMAMRPDGQIFPCCVYRQEEVPTDLNAVSYTHLTLPTNREV